jgi:hypothetical protein
VRSRPRPAPGGEQPGRVVCGSFRAPRRPLNLVGVRAPHRRDASPLRCVAAAAAAPVVFGVSRAARGCLQRIEPCLGALDWGRR